MNWLQHGPRLPFVALALAAASGILVADSAPLSPQATFVAIAAMGAAAAVLLMWSNTASTYVFVACGFFLLHELRTTDTPGLNLAQRLGEGAAVASVRGTVASEPNIAASGLASFLLKLNEVESGGAAERSAAEIFVRWRGRPALGDEMQLFGVCTPVPPPRNPGEFDMRSYLARRDVRRVLLVRYPENGTIVRHTQRSFIVQIAQKTRDWMQRAITRGLDDSPEVQTFLSGIVLGQRHDAQQDEIEEPFQQTGTLHLFAVAGLHVGIIGGLLWKAATLAQLSRRSAAALIIPLLLFYSAVTGLHVSSIRAAVMSSVVAGAFFFDRRAFSLNSLTAAAFILLCVDSNELFATGFQLSFFVVGAIIILADPLGRRFRRWTAPDPFLPATLIRRSRRLLHKFFDRVASGLAVSTAAWIGSFIPIWWYFHLVAPISLLANLVVVPIAFAVLALAMLSLLATPISSAVAVLLNNANWLLASLVIVAVHWFAKIPAGHYYVSQRLLPDNSLTRLTVLDVGAGGAIHLRAQNHNWLFDCGSERDYARVVRPYLHAAGVNGVAAVFLTHGDSLHIGGAIPLLNETPPTLLFDNIAPDRSQMHRRVRQALQMERIETRSAVAGLKIACNGNVDAEVIFPSAGFSAPAADNQAMVVQLHIASARVLLMSDSGETTERTLIGSGRDLRSDIIVKGQNHSGASCTEEFLNAVQPRLIVATSRPFPPVEAIDPQWVEKVRQRGIRVFRQDETGAVEFRFLANEWEARAYFTGETFRSASR